MRISDEEISKKQYSIAPHIRYGIARNNFLLYIFKTYYFEKKNQPLYSGKADRSEFIYNSKIKIEDLIKRNCKRQDFVT